jgi:hypothetical protein
MEGRGRDLVDVPAGAAPTRRWLGYFVRAGSDQEDADLLLDEAVRTSGLLPLIAVGDRRRLALFRERSRHADSVTAEAVQPKARVTSVDALAEQAFNRWHREQQGRAVGDLAEAEALDRITWGLVPVWRAVAAGTAERIWVEHDYASPGRTRPGMDGIETVTDSAEPGVIDDLVDTLIARASGQGISAVLLDPGTLGREEPIAAHVASLATRRPSPGRPVRSDSPVPQ